MYILSHLFEHDYRLKISTMLQRTKQDDACKDINIGVSNT